MGELGWSVKMLRGSMLSVMDFKPDSENMGILLMLARHDCGEVSTR